MWWVMPLLATLGAVLAVFLVIGFIALLVPLPNFIVGLIMLAAAWMVGRRVWRRMVDRTELQA